jgi:TonB-linked SusC/RagA family outer membrane protein
MKIIIHTMQNFKKQTLLIGLVLFAAIANSFGQLAQNGSDSAGIFDRKEFLDQESISLYGKPVSKKYSTTATSSVFTEDLRSINTPSLGNTLPGRLPGLMVSQTGGAPGNSDNPWLQIRGIQTFLDGAAGITVLVDGFETDWNTLHPDEIESITVLKDAAALALYGISGANGIVYIKTKTGQARDKARIIFNSRMSYQQPTVLPKFLNSGDFAEMYNIAMASDGKDIANGYFPLDTIVDFYKNGTYPYLYPDVNWYDQILKPGAFAQDYTIGINGGEERANYNVMLGYSNTPGLYDGTDGKNNSNWLYSKYMSRINLDFEINDWLRAAVKTRGSIISSKQPNTSESGTWRSIGSFLPYDVKTPTGNWGGKEGYRTNPVAQIIQQGFRIENARTIDADIKVTADIVAVKGLSAFGQVVFSNNYYWNYNKTRGLSYEELFPRVDTFGLYTSLIKGDIDQNFSYAQVSGTQWNRFNGLGGLEFTREIGNGVLYASAIYNRTLYRTEYASNNVPYAKINFMGRVNYNHQNKYIGEFGYSYSGSDNYAPGKRFGFFPSISGAWVLSNEDFMANASFINFLKIRASYGMLGNNRIGDLERFPYFEYYGSPQGSHRVGNLLSTSIGSFERSAYPNADATWEKAFKTNIGVETQLFNGLSLSADYFTETREDIFVDPSNYLSVLIGSRYNYLNLGSAKNHGAEVQLMYSKTSNKLSYYVSTSLSYVKTEIIDSKEPPRAEEYLYRRGNPINQPFVLEAIGFFEDDTDILNSPFQTFGAVQPGDIKYKDQNDDGFIDNNDVIPVGNPIYPSLMYAVDLGLSYGNFDFSVFLQGVGGRTISLLNGNQIVPFLNDAMPVQWVKDNYWTPERGNDAQFPRLTTESNDNNYRASTLWQRDGSYVRVKNIELGYTIPGKGITNFRIYLNAVNPLTFDKISEIEVDPEVNNMFTYPMMKSYNLGINLVF